MRMAPISRVGDEDYFAKALLDYEAEYGVPDIAKGLKKKDAGASGSSATTNDKALARLMVSELEMHHERSMAMKKKERLVFLKIRKREVEIRERELAMQEYKQRQKDIMFYMQPYYHLTGDALKQMEDIRAGIKAK
ncbi:hypothetical protein Tco_0827466 [Tanacetum coccineum]